MFDIETYDYHLPPDLLAQRPAPVRDGSRLLCVERQGETLRDHTFRDLPTLLLPGDLLVVNDSRVVPARLYGRKKRSGGRVEVLVLPPMGNGKGSPCCLCLFRSSKGPREGMELILEGELEARVMEVREDGQVVLAFTSVKDLDRFLDQKGRMPLPPYIRRPPDDRTLEPLDRERYQTVFAGPKGSVAAPTAGLHFSRELMEALKHQGISMASVTLHVGYGTFQPVRTRDVRHHKVAGERYWIPPATAEAIQETRRQGGRIVAVGTTVVRTLETAAETDGAVQAGEGITELTILPGFRFRAVDALITNFHLPRSSLLLLVTAFGGLDLVRRAYARAVEKRYRFYSYGDAMLIT